MRVTDERGLVFYTFHLPRRSPPPEAASASVAKHLTWPRSRLRRFE
jgi:hypothetical protein